MSTENGVSNIQKIWFFFFCNLETSSQIPLSKEKAQLCTFHCSQDCVYPVCHNAHNYLPYLKTALNCTLCMPCFQPPVPITHQCSAGAEQWVCAHGRSEKSRHHDSAGGLQNGLGQDACSPHTGHVWAAWNLKVRQNQLWGCYGYDWYNTEVKMQTKFQFPSGPATTHRFLQWFVNHKNVNHYFQDTIWHWGSRHKGQ